VPPSDERYSLALRYIGYNIYLRHLNKPLLAIPYVNRSWLADPFDLTSWMDLCTAYHRVLRSAFHEIGKQVSSSSTTTTSILCLRLCSLTCGRVASTHTMCSPSVMQMYLLCSNCALTSERATT
jgi:hypothetical protein